MFLPKIFIVFLLMPILINCFKCAVSDSSTNKAVTNCESTNYCVTADEYNRNGDWAKTIRQCDSTNCHTTGKRSVYDQITQTTATYDCCTGDYCNSATSKRIFALPVMIIIYVFFK